MPEPITWEEYAAILRANLPRIKEAAEIVRAQYPILARNYKAFYDALIAEGFTSEQALDVVKVKGWLPESGA